jgi:hypothetical protein
MKSRFLPRIAFAVCKVKQLDRTRLLEPTHHLLAPDNTTRFLPFELLMLDRLTAGQWKPRQASMCSGDVYGPKM